ncbi:MAG: efflux RND transporter periplasmic adaptor subunit [Pseudomonadota bacterium]
MRFLTGMCGLLMIALTVVSTNAQENESSQPTVTVATVSSQTVGEKGRYVGRVDAVTTVNLVARVEGFLEKQNFHDGDFVKKGELLYVIEKVLYEADVANAQAQLEGARATLKNSQLDLERQKILLVEEDVPQSTVDQAEATVGANEASVGEAQANLDTASINLGYTDIYSPIDGRIGVSNIDVGNLVDSNSGTLATINSVDPIEVKFFMGEKDLIEDREAGLIGNDDAQLNVKVTLADGSSYPTAGKITYVGTTVEESSDTVEMKATFSNPDNVLIPGQFVNVLVEDANPQETPVVPQSAIQLDSNGHFVYLVDADNKVERRDVTLGRQSGTIWQVSSGLNDGERVITQGLQRVHPGVTVNPVEAKETAS